MTDRDSGAVKNQRSSGMALARFYQRRSSAHRGGGDPSEALLNLMNRGAKGPGQPECVRKR